MKALQGFSFNDPAADVTRLPLSDSDISILRSNAKPDLIADSPTDLFKGLSFQYRTKEHTQLRRAMQTDNPFRGYVNAEETQVNYKKIAEDFGKLAKIAVIDSKGKETGLYIISFNVRPRKYVKIIFDFNAVKSQLNTAKGETIKS
jgi:uncharacterized protein YxeA